MLGRFPGPRSCRTRTRAALRRGDKGLRHARNEDDVALAVEQKAAAFWSTASATSVFVARVSQSLVGHRAEARREFEFGMIAGLATAPASALRAVALTYPRSPSPAAASAPRGIRSGGGTPRSGACRTSHRNAPLPAHSCHIPGIAYSLPLKKLTTPKSHARWLETQRHRGKANARKTKDNWTELTKFAKLTELKQKRGRYYCSLLFSHWLFLCASVSSAAGGLIKIVYAGERGSPHPRTRFVLPASWHSGRRRAVRVPRRCAGRAIAAIGRDFVGSRWP